nr:unnamed protein product [Spirometra erinaceieuropaei]
MVGEIQGYTDQNERENFFAATKAVYCPAAKGTASLLSADGDNAFTERTQILQQWTDNFIGVLNRPSTISDAGVNRLSQVETNADLDLPPALHETVRAVQQLSSGKASGSDAILAEINKHGSPQLMTSRQRSSRRCDLKDTSLRISRTSQSSIRANEN